jgi:hypothetical protein
MSHENGTKYVTLADDKNVHLLADGERTVCGIPIPIAGGAEWTYVEPEKVCALCSKADEKAAELTAERAPFEEGVVLTPESESEPKPAKKATKAK